jgi:hypothetical protein
MSKEHKEKMEGGGGERTRERKKARRQTLRFTFVAQDFKIMDDVM